LSEEKAIERAKNYTKPSGLVIKPLEDFRAHNQFRCLALIEVRMTVYRHVLTFVSTLRTWGAVEHHLVDSRLCLFRAD
jgi:hypothetical protein